MIRMSTVTRIDPQRHPLLHRVAQEAQWVGSDEFPSTEEWATEHEQWLGLIDAHGALGHYLPRLRGPKERRDETFAEIAAIYFLSARCGHRILRWEPPGAGGRRGECLLDVAGQPVFVEVKSPGWEQEIAEAEGQGSPRLTQPKYIQAEARSTAPWASVRHAVTKAYPQLPATLPTLLVINDDLMVQLPDWGPTTMDIALYTPRAPGHLSGYLAEDAPFATPRCAHLGGVGVLAVDLPGDTVRYRFALFDNPHALGAVKLPAGLAPTYSRVDGPHRTR
jgi:hypothetical protein